MRIFMKKGKQRELINFAKQKFTWPELSIKLNISEGYLRNELREEQRLLSKEIYDKLCQIANKNFDKFIIKKINDNWGQVKGGIISKGKTKDIKIPEESIKLAEFFGILLGDGNIYRYKKYKKGTYSVKIVGDCRHDNIYLTKYVTPLIENLFKIRVRKGKFKPKNDFKNSKNSMFIESHGKKLVDFLEQKGLKPGNKIKNNLGIPEWIKKDTCFLRACLRGLYDTDGGIYKLNNQNTHQIVFTNFNTKLLKDIKDSLEKLNIKSSKITSENKIYITKKIELQRFLKLIGFRNSKHLNKIRMWRFNSPVV